MICGACGVEVVEGRRGWLHVDAIPKGVDPDHDVIPDDAAAFTERTGAARDLKAAAQDMILHHGTFHPLDDCEWAKRLGAAARTS